MSVDIINAAKSAFFFRGGGGVSVLETWGNQLGTQGNQLETNWELREFSWRSTGNSTV